MRVLRDELNWGQSVDVEMDGCLFSVFRVGDRATLICSWRDLVWREGRTGDCFGVGGCSRAAAVDVGRDVVDLLAVLVRHGLPVGRSSVRAQDHAPVEAHAGDGRARLHGSLERQAVIGHHLVPRDVVKVEPAPLLPLRHVRRANVARLEQRHLCLL